MNSSRRNFFFRMLIYLAFFASGASSLMAEVTWNRMLIVVVGNSLNATALILMVFMGGLGLGSYVGGKAFGRRRASLIPYLAMELAIGIYVFLSPALFEQLSGFFTATAESVDNRVALTMVRVLVTMAALFVPAFLMGATFPAMIAGTAPRSTEDQTARTGYLYSINTLGAAVGAYFAGYYFLLEFGVRVTLGYALGGYVLAAICALAASRLARPAVREANAAPVTKAEFSTATPALRRFLYVATFGIGFAALAYEVLLTRLGILHLGNILSVFALVLTSFLIGTGISAIAGTWLYGVLSRRTAKADRLFGITALLAGAVVMGTPYLLLTDWLLGPGQVARLARDHPRNSLPILLIMILPTVLIGSLLPMAIRMLHPGERSEATRGAATLYALNTAGGVLGAAIINHFVVPAIGIQGALLMLTTILLAVGTVHLLAPGVEVKRWSVATISVVGLAVLMGFGLPSMMELYAHKIGYSTEAKYAEAKLIQEGRAAIVTVFDQVDPEIGTYRDMYLNGVEEASTRYWHTQLFKLLGIYPVLAHQSDEDKEVLVIAFGAGITAGSVLASDKVSSLDVVDLNPDIEGINDLFTEVNGDVFHKPRFHFHNDDGRNYLVTSSKRYDVIISDSTHPRAYDSWILYTKEFYEAVKKRLSPGGVFAQWVPVLETMQGDLIRIHLNTFRTVFPNATFWYVYGSDQAFLLATPEPFSIDAERLAHQLEALPEWFRAEEYQIDTVERVAGFFWLDGPAMERMIAGETRVNSDNMHYIGKQEATWPLPPQWRLPNFQASAIPYIEGADESLVTAVRREQEVALRMANFAFFGRQPELFQAFCEMPENGNVQYFMSRAFAENIPDHDDFCLEQELSSYRAILAQHPDSYEAMNAIADVLGHAGKLDEALPLAEKALSLAPDNGMVLDTYGWILFKLERHSEALDALNKSLAALPDHPIVLYHLGAVYQAMGNERQARRHLEKALSVSGDFEGAEEARSMLDGNS